MFRQFKFYHWLAASLALHLCAVLPFIATGMHAPYQNKHNKLAIELFGMVSNRQVEEKKKGGPVPRPPRKASPAQAKKAGPKQPPDKPKTAPDSPAPAKTADDKPNPTEQAMDASASASALPAVAAGGDGDQRQQSIQHGKQDADWLREYLRKLARHLQATLVYPQEMRKKGVEGTSTIAFTILESGSIKGDSVRVRKSSGYPALDANAMKSALAAAPFEKPPKELNVAIAVSFTIETLRSRNRALQ